MNEIERLIDNIQFDKPEELRKKAFYELIKIDDDKIPLLIRYKDQNAAEVLREIGYPRVKNYLYELLVWLQDVNWPGSRVIADLLVEVGEPIIPHIKIAFKEYDSIWHLWILSYIVSKWPYELVKELENELIYFIKSFDKNNIAEGVDIEAAEIVIKNNLGDIEDIKNTMRNKNHII
jgi:hypothetical protein